VCVCVRVCVLNIICKEHKFELLPLRTKSGTAIERSKEISAQIITGNEVFEHIK